VKVTNIHAIRRFFVTTLMQAGVPVDVLLQ
jgi:hypothetical protein